MIWNNDKTESKYTTAALALLAGAGAGLAVGILMAPKSGSKTRAEIGAAVEEYLEATRQKAEGVRTSVTNLAQRGLKEVQRTKHNAADKIRETVSGTIDAGAKDAHSAINQTVAAVNSGAAQGHEAVDSAVAAIRTGTLG